MAGEIHRSSFASSQLQSPFHHLVPRISHGFPICFFGHRMVFLDDSPQTHPRYAMCIYSELLVPFMSPHTRTGFRAVAWRKQLSAGEELFISVINVIVPLLYYWCPFISIHIYSYPLIYFKLHIQIPLNWDHSMGINHQMGGYWWIWWPFWGNGWGSKFVMPRNGIVKY